MIVANRDEDNSFVFLASPVADGRYGLTIYPRLPELESDVEVSKRRLRVFLLRHRSEIAVEEISGTEDLFVSSLTADEVRELAGVTEEMTRCASGAPEHE